MALLLSVDGQHFRHASEALRNDAALLRTALLTSPAAFGFASEALQGQRDVATEAVRAELLNLERCSEALRADRGFVLAALRREPAELFRGSLLRSVAKELREDAEEGRGERFM